MSRESIAETEVFKALGDPIRWNIVREVAQKDEYACSLLEEILPVSKPTISYHVKILTQAGLIEVHKRGRNYFYSLRRDVLNEVVDQLWALAPGGPRPASGTVAEGAGPAPLGAAAGDANVTLLTW